MMMKCEICGSVEDSGEALEAGLTNDGEHLHVCSSCVKDRQYAGSFTQVANEPGE